MVEIPNIHLKFKPDRRLEYEEIESQLLQKKRRHVKHLFWGSLIKMNSTYLESPDIVYPQKGRLTMLGGIFGLIFFMGGLYIIVFHLKKYYSNAWSYDQVFNNSTYFLITGIFLFAVLMFSLVKDEIFQYTHKPIRLNRKTRMIHVFRYDGTVLSAPWDEVFFNVVRIVRIGTTDDTDLPGQETYLAGHVIGGKNYLAKETFALCGYAPIRVPAVSVRKFTVAIWVT